MLAELRRKSVMGNQKSELYLHRSPLTYTIIKEFIRRQLSCIKLISIRQQKQSKWKKKDSRSNRNKKKITEL